MIEQRLEDLRAQFRSKSNVGPSEANTLADVELLSELTNSELSEVRRQANQLNRVKASLEAVNHERGPSFGLAQQLTYTSRRAGQDLPDLETHIDVVKGQLKAPLSQHAARFETSIFGTITNNEEWKQVGRSLFNENIDNQQLADLGMTIRSIYDQGLERLNAAGLNINRIENYGLPQKWSSHAVRALAPDYNDSKRAFVNKVFPKLDKERMVDSRGLELDDVQLRDVIAETYDTIVTSGANRAELSLGGRREGRSGSSFEAERILHFNNYDDWFETFNELGSQNIPDLVVGSIDSMATEIGLVEKFGPFYRDTFNILESHVARRIAQGEASGTPIRDKAISNRAVFEQITGDGNVTSNPKVANFFQGLRTFNVATKLGSALLSSLTDVASAQKQANLIGSSFGRVFRDWAVGTFTPLNGNQKKELATHLGYGLHYESFSNSRVGRLTTLDGSANAEQYRFQRSLEKAASFTLNASGLNRSTRVFKDSVSLEVSRYVASLRSTEFDKLPSQLRSYFDLYNINQEEWNILRKASRDFGGVNYIDVSTIDPLSAEKNKLIANFNGLISAIRLRSVPEGNAATRAVFTAGQRGTIQGEFFRSTGQFASLPVANLLNLIDEFKVGDSTKLLSATTYILTAFALGMAQTALKDISRGKIQTEFDSEFVLRSIQESSAFGLLGDQLFSPFDQRNKFTSILSGGPIGVLADSAAYLIWDTTKKGVEGEEINRKGFIDFIEGNVPGQLWYTRLLIQRLMFDKLRDINDPKQAAAWNRMETIYEKRNTPYYWGPNR